VPAVTVCGLLPLKILMIFRCTFPNRSKVGSSLNTILALRVLREHHRKCVMNFFVSSFFCYTLQQLVFVSVFNVSKESTEFCALSIVTCLIWGAGCRFCFLDCEDEPLERRLIFIDCDCV
jgi:hypothetical protein